MASEKTGRAPHPFDVATVERLIGLMAANDLSEISLRDGVSRIRLRRGGPAPAYQTAPSHAPAPATAHIAAPQSTNQTSHAHSSSTGKKHHVITSPTPGTFYSKPSPDDAPYVKVGSKVGPETVVCKIEAMKIFNDITAECTGTVAEILVDNAHPVEYGQPLFKIEIA